MLGLDTTSFLSLAHSLLAKVGEGRGNVRRRRLMRIPGTLLNRLFGTTFDVMDETKRQQTTKGMYGRWLDLIWSPTCVQESGCVVPRKQTFS